MSFSMVVAHVPYNFACHFQIWDLTLQDKRCITRFILPMLNPKWERALSHKITTSEASNFPTLALSYELFFCLPCTFMCSSNSTVTYPSTARDTTLLWSRECSPTACPAQRVACTACTVQWLSSRPYMHVKENCLFPYLVKQNQMTQMAYRLTKSN